MRRIKFLVFCVAVQTTILILFAARDSGARTASNISNESLCTSTHDFNVNKSQTLPRHIHQMFFYMTDKTLPERLDSARLTWENQHSGFSYTLWNSSMVDKLINESYPQLRDLYYGYSHWVRRADMARYLVLYEYGGIYIDLDIKSTGKDLENLYKTFTNTTDVVLYLTSPPVVSNDFMITKSQHPFMKHVICGLESANRWYVLPYLTTMFSTGPMFLHAQFKSYSEKQEIHLLPEAVMKKFVRHMTGSSWHQWDGVVIWWLFSHLKQVISGCLIVLCVVVVMLLIRKFKVTLRGLFVKCKGNILANVCRRRR